MPRHLVVSLHDAHPGSREAIQEQVEALRGWAVGSTSILVVPRFHAEPSINSVPFDGDTAFPAAMSELQRDGHELVLHGFYHQRVGPHGRTHAGNVFWTKFYTNNEAEFLDLPDDEARRRIEDGRQLFGAMDWTCEGFIAPAWLMPRTFPELLKSMGFLYTNTLKSLIPLTTGDISWMPSEPLAAQSLCWSTREAWRRSASLMWNDWLFPRLTGGRVLRLSLHPNDLRFPRIREQVRTLIGRALEHGYEPATYATAVKAL